MSIQLAWKPQRGEQSAADEPFPSAPPASCAEHKAALLEAITRGEHLVTLLGQACRIIADATGDPAFYEEARLRVRCRGVAENHLPSLQEQWDSLTDEIERTVCGYHVETDPDIKVLWRAMCEGLSVKKERLTKLLTDAGYQRTADGWQLYIQERGKEDG